MPRIRSIKPEFWTSESNGRLTRDGRLVFVGLISMADDEGRFRGSVVSIAAAVLPFDADGQKVVARELPALVSEGKIVLFRHKSDSFGEIVNWPEHQRIDKPKQSRFPSSRDPDSSLQNVVVAGAANPRRVADASTLDGMGRDGKGSRRGSGKGMDGNGKGQSSAKGTQAELPDIPPAPPPAPRQKSAQELAYEHYRVTRLDTLSQIGLEQVDETDQPNPGFINMALGPILKSTEPFDLPRHDVLGWDRLLTLWFDQKWAANMDPPFPFNAFVSDRVQKGDRAKNLPGLIERLANGE